VVGAGGVLERREHDPLADRLERPPGGTAVGREGPRVGPRMSPGEERLEVAVCLFASLDPGGDLEAGEGTAALLRRSHALVEVLGRPVLPPSEVARVFNAEFGTPAAQLDLVRFLDGRGANDVAVESDVEAFRQSWRRPKWSTADSAPPPRGLE
jgi:hypothetical protein